MAEEREADINIGIVADKVFSTDALGVFYMSYFIARRPRYIEVCKIY